MTARKRTTTGRPTTAQLAQRKARVLQVAEKLFTSHGFAGTSVAEISKLSRVSPRLIASHFGDKSAIFSAVIDVRSERAFTLATDATAADCLEDILFGAARFAWTVAYAQDAVEFQRLVVAEGSRFTEATSNIARKASDHFFGEMEAIFEITAQKGMTPAGDYSRIAKYFVDLIVGFSLVQAGMGYWDRVPDDAELRDKIRFFCRSLDHFAAPSA